MNQKTKSAVMAALSLCCSALGLVFFRMLTAVSFETSERPELVVICACAAMFLAGVATYKDYGKLPSILAYAASTLTIFLFLEGRASYLAFYFTGDVLHTGLSIYMILAFAAFLLALIFALLAVVFEGDRKRERFAAGDLIILLPMLVVCAALCFVTVQSAGEVGGTPVQSENASVNEPAASVEAAPAAETPAARYLTPTQPEEKWQSYSAQDYAKEDANAKEIAYQIIGHGTVSAGEERQVDALLNLYKDGEALLTVLSMNHRYIYYGYWTNVNDENLWFCVAYYTHEGADKICTIDYSYDLTGKFDELPINIALGLADGGQFVRNVAIGGNDGSVQHPNIEKWLADLGYVAPEPTEVPAAPAATEAPAAAEAPASTEAPAEEAAAQEETSSEKTVFIPFTSDAESFKVDLYDDGTYKFQFTSMNIEETGTWTWKDWTLTLTTPAGKTYEAKPDGETHALNLHFIPDLSEQLVRDYTCPSDVWGVAFNGQGSYETAAPEEASAAEPAAVAEPKIIVPFTSDAESFKVDLYDDGTYKFQFTSMNIEETGTWTWKDWTLTLTTPAGKTYEAKPDGETHALNLHFIPDLSEQLVRDYTCPSDVWGVAFNGQGSYEIAAPAEAPAEEPAMAAESQIIVPFTSDAESFKVDLYDDGTYKFQFTSMNIEEAGTWTWKDWTLTLTTPAGKTYEAKPDGETHALNLHFIPDLSEQLVRDYTCPSDIWGVAFKGQGDY